MRKLLHFSLLLAAIALLPGNILAQQNAGANKAAAPAAKAQQTPAAPSSGNSSLTNEKDKFSYALGMNLGTNLSRQSVPVNLDMIMQGLKDSMGGGKTLMTEDEARNALMQKQAEIRQQQEEKAKAQGVTNQKEGDAFLAANKSKEGVVTLPSGLQYKILKTGTGPKPAATDSVVCNYTGTLIDGKEFDSSAKHGGPATFPVSGVIKGWTEALQLMPVGSEWQLFVPPTLAYGERGAGADIGPNATLLFDVELVSIVPKAPAAQEKK
jgi:FKBP-type peptidyl-prolyl cis-trans isomerase FklB